MSDFYLQTGIPKTAPAASTNGPAKVAPTAPRSSGDATPIPNGDGVKTELELSPAAEPGTAAASGASGPQVLRQKLEQTRSRNVSGTALPKEELGSVLGPHREHRDDVILYSASPTSSASQVARTDTPLALDASTPQQPGENGEYRKPAATPPPTPAGPRATRSGAPTGPARLSQGNVQASSETRNTPTGPSRPSPAATPQPSPKPAPSQPSSMGPPNPSLSIDEARAAARARKFGMISKPLPPSAPSAPAAQVKSELLSAAEFSASRNQSLTPEAPRRSPPPIAMRSARRSGSVESRVSERSRRDTRDREDRERDRTRDTRGVDTIKPRGNGTRSRTASERKPGDEAAERRRQEGLLQARHERLVPADKKVETRRSSRDGHRRETEKEREERKAKERDTDRAKRNDRERTKDGAIGENEDAGLKRKRDEVSHLSLIIQCSCLAAPSPD